MNQNDKPMTMQDRHTLFCSNVQNRTDPGVVWYCNGTRWVYIGQNAAGVHCGAKVIEGFPDDGSTTRILHAWTMGVFNIETTMSVGWKIEQIPDFEKPDAYVCRGWIHNHDAVGAESAHLTNQLLQPNAGEPGWEPNQLWLPAKNQANGILQEWNRWDQPRRRQVRVKGGGSWLETMDSIETIWPMARRSMAEGARLIIEPIETEPVETYAPPTQNAASLHVVPETYRDQIDNEAPTGDETES